MVIEHEPKTAPVEERAEEASPLVIEKKEVATPTPTIFKSQVSDDKGQPLITSSLAKPITITLPADDSRLGVLVKGSVDDSLTWFAAFWLRLIKKAVHFGWQVKSAYQSSLAEKKV